MSDQKENTPLFTPGIILFIILIVIIIVTGVNLIVYFSKHHTTEQFIPSETTELISSDSSAVFLTEDTINSSNANKYHIEVVVKTEAGDSTGAIIQVLRNGTYVETDVTQTKHSLIDLDFNTTYILTFFKDGFVKKSIYFDTYVPKGKENDDFNSFFMEVTLVKKTKYSIDDPINIVGGVKYDSLEDDFRKVKQ